MEQKVLNENDNCVQNMSGKEEAKISEDTEDQSGSQNDSLPNDFKDRKTNLILDPVGNIKSIQENYLSIGLLKSQWKDQQEITGFNYGSALALTNRIILTCSHNIYSEKRQKFCSQVLFFPNVNGQQLNEGGGYRSCKGQFFRCQVPYNTFILKPSKQQLCLIVLQRSLNLNSFIEIGNLSDEEKQIKGQLAIVGYPSQTYENESNIENVKSDRHQQSGKIVSFQDEDIIINHDMKTKRGQSGSSILYFDQGRWKAIGIHTHKGVEGKYNSGLYFTPQIISLIKKFQKELSCIYNLTETINCAAKNVEDEIPMNQESSNFEDEIPMNQENNINVEDEISMNQESNINVEDEISMNQESKIDDSSHSCENDNQLESSFDDTFSQSDVKENINDEESYQKIGSQKTDSLKIEQKQHSKGQIIKLSTQLEQIQSNRINHQEKIQTSIQQKPCVTSPTIYLLNKNYCQNNDTMQQDQNNDTSQYDQDLYFSQVHQQNWLIYKPYQLLEPIQCRG